MNFPLRTVVAVSPRVWKIVSIFSQYFSVSSLVSSLTHWLFNSVLLLLHVCIFSSLPEFQTCALSWRILHVPLKLMCILQLGMEWSVYVKSLWFNVLFKVKFPLLIFCLDNTDLVGVLKFHVIIVLLVSPLMSVNICFVCRCSCVGYIGIY